MLYRNTGAPFSSENGRVVGRDEVFEPTVSDLARRRYKLKPVLDAAPGRAAPTPVTQDEEPVTTLGYTPAPGSTWPLRMSPELYLRVHPEGQHAEAARAVIAETAVEPEEKHCADE